MRNVFAQFAILVLAIALGYVYYFVDFGQSGTDKIFITITTFIFSTFVGFFIARQGARYSRIREIISTFDGKMSACFRASKNVSEQLHKDVGAIILDHYQTILGTKQWNYHFINKSNTLSGIHAALEKDIGDTKETTLRAQAIGRILTTLSDCQVLRKNMVMLYHERMINFQWILMCVFVAILLATISVVPSVGAVFPSLLKAAFATTIIAVMLILRDLDDLHLFESFIGENSARDVVEVISGTK